MSKARFLCLKIPDLEMQLVYRRLGYTESVSHPLFIVEEDRPSTRVIALNSAAASLGIRVGMRYTAALSLSAEVQASVISPEERRLVTEEIRDLLLRFLPGAEVWALQRSVFWGDIRGMDRLGAESRRLYQRISNALKREHWYGGIAIGWTRPGTLFGAYALSIRAASSQSTHIRSFSSEREEKRWYLSQPIDPLPFNGRDRDRFSLLGISRVDEFVALPPESLKSRFSQKALDLYRFLKGNTATVPVQQTEQKSVIQPVLQRYEPPIRDTEVLFSACTQLLSRVIADVQGAGLWIRRICFEMTDDRRVTQTEELNCGGLTRDLAYIQRLLKLRIEHVSWVSREIEAITLSVSVDTPLTRQGYLPSLEEPGKDRFDIDRMERAIALVRAQLGNEAVFLMRSRSGRVPEQRFQIELSHKSIYTPIDSDHDNSEPLGPLLSRVRRLLEPPIASKKYIVLYSLVFRYTQTGAWWNTERSERVYAYLEGRDGVVRWVYRSELPITYTHQGILS